MKRPFKKLYGLLLTWVGLFLFLPQIVAAQAGKIYSVVDTATSAEDGLSAFWTGATWVGEGLLSITGFFLWIGGITYDWVLQNWVFNMGALLKGVDALYIGWSAFRDVGNIIIIFGLLAIGIATILRISGYGMKDLLVKLVIVAMLINFSFIFTTTIIDTSNFLAFQFYTKADTSGAVQGETISVRFANALKLQTIYNGLRDSGGAVTEQNQESTTGTFTRGLSGQQLFLAQFFGSVLLLITAFSFLAASFLLIIRFGVLILLIVISPVAFVLMAIPKGAGLAGQWWSKLLSHAFYAPVYMLFVYITLIIIEDAAFLGQTSSGQLDFSELFKGTSGAIVIMANYLIITVFMLASIILGSKMGLAGSSMVMRMAKWTRGQTSRPFRRAGREVRGYAARTTKRTTSGLSRRVEKIGADKSKPEADRKKGIGASVGRGFARVVDYTPGARVGLQRGGQYFVSDTKRRAEELGKYRSGELQRRMAAPGMKTPFQGRDKVAIAQALVNRGDADDLNVKQVREAIDLLKSNGLGTRALEIMRPDALYKEDDPSAMEAAMSKIGSGDISKLDKVIVSKIDGDGSEKENADAITSQLTSAMARVFDGRKMLEALRQGNEVSKSLYKELDKISPPDEDGHRSVDAIADKYEASSKEERKAGNEKIANAQLSVATAMRTTAARRLLEVPEKDRVRNKPAQGGSSSGNAGGGSNDEGGATETPEAQDTRTRHQRWEDERGKSSFASNAGKKHPRGQQQTRTTFGQRKQPPEEEK